MASAFHVVQVPLGIDLHPTHRLMKVRGVHGVDVERLVPIGLAIAVEINQTCHLIPPDDEDLVEGDRQLGMSHAEDLEAVDHPLRGLDNTVLTGHTGYVVSELYELVYGEAIEGINAWIAGTPVRVLNA